MTILMVAIMSVGFVSCGDDENTSDVSEVAPNNTKQEIQITSSGKVDGFECVDLGLSVKWATSNIGAYAPEGYGSYFAWGEIKEKDSYFKENYSLLSDGKYADYGNDISRTYHDAAYVKWGNKWRMPTYAELEELHAKCTFEWVIYKDVEGAMFTAPNGNTIFFPASGNKYGYSDAAHNWNVSVWGSTLWPWGKHYDISQCSSAVATLIIKGQTPGFQNLERHVGCPIRPVTTASFDSSDNSGNESNDGGDNNQSNDAPYITSFSFTATKTSITVKFMASERPTSASVKYGENSANKTISSNISGKQISATATGLKAGTKYYFKCTVKNSYGSSTSDSFAAITNY